MSAFPKVENFSHSFVEKARRVNQAQFSTLWKTISDDGGGVFHKKSTKEENLWKTFFAKNSRFRRSAGADSKKPPVFVENALRFLWNTLKMKSIFCTILLKNAYLSLHFASFRV